MSLTPEQRAEVAAMIAAAVPPPLSIDAHLAGFREATAGVFAEIREQVRAAPGRRSATIDDVAAMIAAALPEFIPEVRQPAPRSVIPPGRG